MKEVKSETNSDRNFILVVTVALIVLLAKLVFSYHVFGTNDMMYWMDFARIIQQFGTFKIYGLVKIYNHPPLVSWMLKVIAWVSTETGLGFPFVFRLLPIFADFASVLILWKLLELYKVRNRMAICAIFVLNPVNCFISAFHGNTDPVFVFLILLSIYLNIRHPTPSNSLGRVKSGAGSECNKLHSESLRTGHLFPIIVSKV